jgi:hypothetical protein
MFQELKKIVPHGYPIKQTVFQQDYQRHYSIESDFPKRKKVVKIQVLSSFFLWFEEQTNNNKSSQFWTKLFHSRYADRKNIESWKFNRNFFSYIFRELQFTHKNCNARRSSWKFLRENFTTFFKTKLECPSSGVKHEILSR